MVGVVQHVRAPQSAVYAALLDADAVERWRVPDGMRSEVHLFEPTVGGRFRVSLTYDGDRAGKSGGRTDTYHGRFERLVPDELVVEVSEFETDDPTMQGELTMTTTLTRVAGGTDVEVSFTGLPPGVDPADNETGTQMALARLAALFEAAR